MGSVGFILEKGFGVSGSTVQALGSHVWFRMDLCAFVKRWGMRGRGSNGQ